MPADALAARADRARAGAEWTQCKTRQIHSTTDKMLQVLPAVNITPARAPAAKTARVQAGTISIQSIQGEQEIQHIYLNITNVSHVNTLADYSDRTDWLTMA